VSHWLHKQQSSIKLFKIDHLKNKEIGERFGVDALPKTVLVVNGTVIAGSMQGVVGNRPLFECLQAWELQDELCGAIEVPKPPEVDRRRHYTEHVRFVPQQASPEELRNYTKFKRDQVQGGLGQKGKAVTDRHDGTLDAEVPHQSPTHRELMDVKKNVIHRNAPSKHDDAEAAVSCRPLVERLTIRAFLLKFIWFC